MANYSRRYRPRAEPACNCLADKGKGGPILMSEHRGTGRTNPGIYCPLVTLILSGKLPLLSVMPALTFLTREHYRPLASSKLHRLVTEVHMREWLTKEYTQQRNVWELNPLPPDRLSDALKLRATQLSCWHGENLASVNTTHGTDSARRRTKEMKRSNLIPIIQSGVDGSRPRPLPLLVWCSPAPSGWQRSLLRHGSRRSLPPSTWVAPARPGSRRAGGRTCRCSPRAAVCAGPVRRTSLRLPAFGRRWVVSEVRWRWIVLRFSSNSVAAKLLDT